MTRRNIDISDELWQALKIEAAVQGVTIKVLVARLLAKETKPKRTRIDWSNVVVDEGDEEP